MKVYEQGNCGICGKATYRSGQGMVAHLRAHVKKGELIEQKPWQGGKVMFKSKEDNEWASCSAYF